MNKKTLFISDLDETLLNKNSVLSEYTKSILNKLISFGVSFTVATGRTTDAAQQIMSEIKLSVPIITFNGAIVYDTTEKSYVKVYQFCADAVRSINAVLKSNGSTALMYEIKDNKLLAYYEMHEHKPISDFIEDRKTRYNSNFCLVNRLDDVSLEHIMYFTLKDKYNRIKPVYDALQIIPGINLVMVDDTSIDGYWWLEVFSADASKGKAVTYLRETYGYEKIVGFGDNYNDLPMFKSCDTRVAVKNVLDEVKNVSDFICGSNDEDGVARWIEENTLSNN